MDIEQIQQAIREESAEKHLDGWFFCNFSHRDKLTDTFFALDERAVSSRRWFYIVPPRGEPVKIVHIIEKNVLDSLPGKTLCNSGQDELRTLLHPYAGAVFAAFTDADIPVVSTVDGGTAAFLASADITLVSAAPLIQRYKGVLSPAQIQSHEKAAGILYRTTERAWDLVCGHFKRGAPLTEKTVAGFILGEFDAEGLTTDHCPIVAFGPNTANPHYEVPENGGRTAQPGDIVQFDMWAKYPGGIYADISWVGIYGSTAPEDARQAFSVLVRARDTVYSEIERRHGDPVTGAELDRAVRSVLCGAGFENAIRHRTGHGIDTDCHGSGVNLDSCEFPDSRKIIEGSCFSVEPGIYLETYGMRTEVNIYISHGRPVISGAYAGTGNGHIQREILTTR